MNVVLVGHFTETAKNNIRAIFPPNYRLDFAEPGEEAPYLENCDILIPEHILVNEELLAKALRLKLVQTGAGYDNVDVNACTQKGVWAANAAGVNAQAVAEHVLAFLFCHYKNIPLLNACMKGERNETFLNYQGAELNEKTIGIIGLGAIGRKVAFLCHSMGMKVLGYDVADFPCEDYIQRVSLEELQQNSDAITLHIFLNEQTKGMVNNAFLQKMKNNALLINTARGGIVCEADLIQTLRENPSFHACLDVFETEPLPKESPLRELDNVLLTPHTAGMPNGLKFHKARYRFFLENCEKIARGEAPASALNRL